jgi:hypothetical protein
MEGSLEAVVFSNSAEKEGSAVKVRTMQFHKRMRREPAHEKKLRLRII